jgi:hypothetical protein
MAEKKERKLGGYLAKLNATNNERRARIKEALQGEFVAYCGDPVLQWISGGYIRARLNLLWGPSKSGKSTFALKWAGQEQRKRGPGFYVIIYDSEFNYEEDNPATIERFVACGLDPDYVIIAHGGNMDKLFAGVADLRADIDNGDLKVAAIVVDSWGGVHVDSAMEKIKKNEISDAGNSFGGNAKFIGPMINFFLDIAGEYGVTCFFVQHCMVNIEQYGKRYLLIGGQKLRFLVHCSLFFETVEAQDARLGVAGQIEKKDVDEVAAVGKRIRSYCDKSRQLVEGRKGEFWFDFEKAIFACRDETLFELATRLNVVAHPIELEVDKRGNPKLDDKGNQVFKEKNAYWCFPADSNDPNSVQWHGKPNMVAALADANLYDAIFKECMNSTKKNITDDQTDMKKALEPTPEELQAEGIAEETSSPSKKKKGK